MSPLHWASLHNLELIKILIKYGANINAQDNRGNTALHYSILENKLQSLYILRAHGASCNIKDWAGYTPADLIQQKGLFHLIFNN